MGRESRSSAIRDWPGMDSVVMKLSILANSVCISAALISTRPRGLSFCSFSITKALQPMEMGMEPEFVAEKR